MLSFVIGGIACAFVGLCYAELAAMLPVSGSAYTYTYATLGEIFAWIIGWDLILEYAMGAATVAVGWSGYFAQPPAQCRHRHPRAVRRGAGNRAKPCRRHGRHGIVNLPAALIVGLITLLLIMGTKESARLNNIMVVVKLAVVVGVHHSRRRLCQHGATGALRPRQHRHIRRVRLERRAARLGRRVLRLYRFRRGLDRGARGKNPQRDMPIGILGFAGHLHDPLHRWSRRYDRAVPYPQLNVADPIAKAVDVIGLTWFSVLIKIGALAGLTTVILVLLYGQSRIFFTMSKDGLLPPLFAKVHPNFGTPWQARHDRRIVA